jgi:hypothetical protein
MLFSMFFEARSNVSFIAASFPSQLPAFYPAAFSNEATTMYFADLNFFSRFSKNQLSAIREQHSLS